MIKKICAICAIYGLWVAQGLMAQQVSVGSGSYTTQFPGTDVAGRNSFPSGTPLVVDSLKNKPIPTNDWWSAKLKSPHCDNLFNYPLTMKTVNKGLVVSYIPWGVISDIEPITVGVKDMNVSQSVVSHYSDWTVTLEWKQSSRRFQVTAGMGMPMLYFQKEAADSAVIVVNSGTVSVHGANLLVENAYNGADFVVYGPSGSVWSKRGNTYISALNGKNYWSMLMLPQSTANLKNAIDTFQRFAFVEPVDTRVDWSFNEKNNQISTEFTCKIKVHEGKDSQLLFGLLPHHSAYLAGNKPTFIGQEYTTVRGKLTMVAGTRFEVLHQFNGILPTLPYVDYLSKGFNPSLLQEKIEELQFEGLSTWTDSYNEGQVMNRLIQTARIAHEMGNTEAVNAIVSTIKTRLEDWLTAKKGEVAFLFYYNKTWTSMLGYPAGHGQDNNLNDHHFHWGYFIHAASFLEEFQPGWAKQFGPMVNLLVRDAASSDRKDTLFPFLRNFNPYTGHCWANGFASFPQGNDQESTSESMQFNSSLIHWGMVTGNTAIRDLGIYLYCTEKSAIEEYWFDIKKQNFSKTQPYALVSRVWGNSYDNGTFWTNDIAASYGIELYPIHGGSFYLAHDSNYVKRLWAEMSKNTGILSNQANDNLWHDVYWKYAAFTNPAQAISLYNSYPKRNLKFGVSDAQTYHWLHSLNALGRFQPSITSNYPLSMAFTKGSEVIYVGKNYSSDTIIAKFSTGYQLRIPPRRLITSIASPIIARIQSEFSQYYSGTRVPLQLDSFEMMPDSVVWYQNGQRMPAGSSMRDFMPLTQKLSAGKYNFYALVFVQGQVSQSNILSIIVGEQRPYQNSWASLPGTLESGKFDEFEGGNAQGISYMDIGKSNLGNARMLESADVAADPKEGMILTWLENSEWYEYSVNIAESGLYRCTVRYSNGNTSASKGFELLLDEQSIGSTSSLAPTGKWESFSAVVMDKIPLRAGKRLMKIKILQAGFNLSSLTFEKVGELASKPPIAHAGGNQSVKESMDTVQLSGAKSTAGSLGYLRYEWSQWYGPNRLELLKADSVVLVATGLQSGVYKFNLRVYDSLNEDQQSVFVFVGDGANILPEISISTSGSGTMFIAGQKVVVTAAVNDADGDVQRVVFHINGDSMVANAAPFKVSFLVEPINYQVVAAAYDNAGGMAHSDTLKFSAVSVAGDWKLLASAGSMAVGPDRNNLIWWSNSSADVQLRACLFDDIYRIGEDQIFSNVLQGQTWLEGWQNNGKEACGTPKSPHDGTQSGTWRMDTVTGEWVVTGKGQYLGLPKVTNSGELGNSGVVEPLERRYELSLVGGNLIAGIQFGTGFWQFKLVRAIPSNGTIATENLLGWKLVPNPADGSRVEIWCNQPVLKVRVYNASGVKMLEGDSTLLDVDGMTAGIYLVQIETAQGSSTQRLIRR